MGRKTNKKVLPIAREYGHRPEMKFGEGDYVDMARALTNRASWNIFLEKHSEFEKPYYDLEYPEMQHFHPRELKFPYADHETYRPGAKVPSTPPGVPDDTGGRCISNIELGPAPPWIDCGTKHQFFPIDGRPPFEFFMIVGRGTITKNGLYTAPECGSSCEEEKDRDTVGLRDACTEFSTHIIRKGKNRYPSHVSTATFKIRHNTATSGGDLFHNTLSSDCKTGIECGVAGGQGSFCIEMVNGKPPFELHLDQSGSGSFSIALSWGEDEYVLCGECRVVGCNGNAKIIDDCGREGNAEGTIIFAGNISISGPGAPVDNDTYDASGGTGPYTWKLEDLGTPIGTITATDADTARVTNINGECPCAKITARDATGCIGEKLVRLPGGVWSLETSCSIGAGCNVGVCSGTNTDVDISGDIRWDMFVDCCTGSGTPTDCCADTGAPCDHTDWSCGGAPCANNNCCNQESGVDKYRWVCP